MSDHPAAVRLDVYSDYTCPWCYIGWARLEKALALLPPDAESSWIDPELSLDAAQALLVPYPGKTMVASVASRRVNRAGPDDADLFVPDEGDEDLLNTLLVA